MDSFSYFGALDFLLNDLFRLFLTKWMDWEKKQMCTIYIDVFF